MIAGEIPVFPKHWWEGTDAQGRKRDISATTLEIPLGSGSYRIKEFVAARSVVLERVTDYWGKDIPAGVGQDNFDEIRYEFFRDDTVGLEAFKADQLDWISERSAKQWAVAYDFPAVRDKRVIKERFPDLSSGRMQGFAFNLRRPLFTDIKVRRAFNYAYDFEEADRQLSTGEYHRDSSFFDGIPELMSSGLPEGKELQILETVRDKVPAEVFTTPYKNPVGGNPEAARNNLREATRLLKEAGFEVRDASWSIPRGSRSVSNFCARIRAKSAACCSTSPPGAARHHRERSHRRQRAVPKSRPQFRLRHRHRPYGGSRCRPAMSSAISSDRRRRIGRDRATFPASRIPRSMP